MALVLNRPVEGRWRGKFVWSATRGGPRLEVRRFRTRLELSTPPREFLVHVSADSRYRLWVNGTPVGRGPLKGTLEHYFYETYDLAPYLQAGANVLAAEVQWFGLDAPNSEVHSGYAGFLFQGPEGAGVDTPGAWKIQVDEALSADRTSYIANAQGFLGFCEHLDGAKVPQGWREASFDDSGWEAPVVLLEADWPPNWGEFAPLWNLQPREIPALPEAPKRFVRAFQGTAAAGLPFGPQPHGWTIPAGQRAELTLDAGGLTTGFPELRFSGGRGAKVTIVYAEAVGQWSTQGKRGRWYLKQVRDDLASGEVDGYRDTVLLPGGAFVYEPFHWRTFWFVKLIVEAGPEAVTVADCAYRFTAYPQTLQAAFQASDPDLEKLFALSWRTLELCSHETYEDCPYYEQLHYIYDARLEALQGYALANDRELPRRTIRLFRDSMRSDGLVHCRVPSRRRQIIPFFALHWVMTVEEFWRWWGAEERAFVRGNLLAVDGVLHWFREQLREDDFTGPLPFWNPVNGGGPGLNAAAKLGGSTYMTGLFVWALEAAVRLHEEAGIPDDAARWRKLAARLRLAIRENAWCEREGLFLEAPGAEGPTAASISQHTQVQAILSGAATAEQTARILKRLTSDPALAQTVTSNTFDLCRALEAAGAYGAFHDPVLKPWREMIAKRMSTLWETDSDGRSDCHAWTSWVAYDFLTCVLGIQPARAGFEEIRIRPLTDGLAHAAGQMPTPKGPVHVSWRREGARVRLEAETPAGVPVTVELPGAGSRRFEQGGRIEC
ncbi:MAG: alpha-L-rhamnosidase N-terminal domain-containing protein [Planctomycetes bacterium]|nr:alpha-L-rhamnosidase N-terminal domain-containing protein [Planctomycetota bacterium]